MPRTPFRFLDRTVDPGSRARVHIPVSLLPTGGTLMMLTHVLHGAEDGPVIWLSGAIHGDEIVGVEIIRQVLDRTDERELAGTILAVPVVNVFGFLAESRYLPDRRDLNRSFPGSKRGSNASQLARLFMDNIVEQCELGLDFHAGSNDRTNLPQIRGDLHDPEVLRLARAFAPPLAIHSKTIKGSLRDAVKKRGKRCLLFEGGEPRRFSPAAVDAGVDGTMRVLAALGMVSGAAAPSAGGADGPPDRALAGGDGPAPSTTCLSRKTTWVRAPRGGIFRLEKRLGTMVEKNERLGIIGSPEGREKTPVLSTTAGMVMGHAVNPLVHRGDGLVHLAEISDTDEAP